MSELYTIQSITTYVFAPRNEDEYGEAGQFVDRLGGTGACIADCAALHLPTPLKSHDLCVEGSKNTNAGVGRHQSPWL